MRIITISREFGSGGRELGKRLADALGIAYYDREIISTIAEKSALNEDYIESVIEGNLYAQYPFTFSHTLAYMPTMKNNPTELLLHQHAVIRELASKGDCVIVGREADITLQDYNPLKLFVYADMPSKIERCQKRAAMDENLSDREMERKIKQIDKARARNHDMVSPFAWGDKRGYHLCINTTGADIPSLVPILASYAKAWFE